MLMISSFSNVCHQDFDVHAALMAGGGKAHGRLLVGDGAIDPASIPTLRQLRRGLGEDSPAVERRPRFPDPALEEIRVRSSPNQISHNLLH